MHYQFVNLFSPRINQHHSILSCLRCMLYLLHIALHIYNIHWRFLPLSNFRHFQDKYVNKYISLPALFQIVNMSLSFFCVAKCKVCCWLLVCGTRNSVRKMKGRHVVSWRADINTKYVIMLMICLNVDHKSYWFHSLSAPRTQTRVSTVHWPSTSHHPVWPPANTQLEFLNSNYFWFSVQISRSIF